MYGVKWGESQRYRQKLTYHKIFSSWALLFYLIVVKCGNLSGGQQDIGNEGVATRCGALSLRCFVKQLGGLDFYAFQEAYRSSRGTRPPKTEISSIIEQILCIKTLGTLEL